MAIGALLRVEAVRSNAKHIVALNADAVNDSSAAGQFGVFRCVGRCGRRMRRFTHTWDSNIRISARQVETAIVGPIWISTSRIMYKEFKTEPGLLHAGLTKDTLNSRDDLSYLNGPEDNLGIA